MAASSVKRSSSKVSGNPWITVSSHYSGGVLSVKTHKVTGKQAVLFTDSWGLVVYPMIDQQMLAKLVTMGYGKVQA